MVHLAYLMLLLPLAGFLFLVTFGRRIGDPVAGWIGTVAVGGAFVVACIVLAGLLGLPDNGRVVVDNYFTWFSAGGLSVPVGTLVDPLSMTMCMFVTGVSALIRPPQRARDARRPAAAHAVLQRPSSSRP